MSDFLNTLLASGLRARDVVPDGKWHRCPTNDKPRKKNGVFLLTLDGRRGVFKNYALDTDFSIWTDGKPLSESDKRDMTALATLARAQERRRREIAMRSMEAHWHSLQPLRGGHPYLEAKGLRVDGCAGLRVDDDKLVIPMRKGGRLMSLQTITTEGEKKYRAGCPVGGATFDIERRSAQLTCYAEGFATGLAVFQCLPLARVRVCFDAGNLVRVAEEVGRRPGMAVVCADNDWTGARNAGIEKGSAAAELLGCGIAYPQGIEGSDWADALQEWGSSARVRVEVMRGAKYVTADRRVVA